MAESNNKYVFLMIMLMMYKLVVASSLSSPFDNDNNGDKMMMMCHRELHCFVRDLKLQCHIPISFSPPIQVYFYCFFLLFFFWISWVELFGFAHFGYVHNYILICYVIDLRNCFEEGVVVMLVRLELLVECLHMNFVLVLSS